MEKHTTPAAPSCDIATQDGTGYVLDIGTITGEIFNIKVPAWDLTDGLGGPRPGDEYTVYFNDQIYTREEVADKEEALWPWYQVPFYTWEVPNASYDVYYTLWDQVPSNPKSKSDIYKLQIKGSEAIAGLPAPAFPKSTPIPDTKNQRVEYFSEIVADHGVQIEAQGIDDAVDTVTFCWIGYDMDGTIIPESKCIVPGSISNGTAYGVIPKQHVLCLGPSSKGTAYYHVHRAQNNNNDFTQSFPADLEISFENIATLEINVTQDAPAKALGTSFQGYGVVRVFGSPGSSVEASLPGDSPCQILESMGNNKKDYPFTLDEYGMGILHVAPNNENNTTITLVLESPAYTAPPQLISFSDARSDPSDDTIIGYAYTTGAAADSAMFGDNVSYCTIYAKVDLSKHSPNGDTLSVTVGGRARISGYPDTQTADIPLDDDGTAAVDIVDSFVETIPVSLGITNHTPVQFEIEFAAFPSWRQPVTTPSLPPPHA